VKNIAVSGAGRTLRTKKQKKERDAKLKRYKWPSDKKCSKCKYSVLIEGHYCCDYLNIVGRMRGCEYGDKCTEFVKRGRMFRL
jgi:hypothetical protein